MDGFLGERRVPHQEVETVPAKPPHNPSRAKRSVHPNSLANLKQNNIASHTSGAHSELAVRPFRERYLAELRAEFPNASERRLLIQANRLGQLDLLAAFTDERGVIRHRRRGDVFPAASLAEKIASAYLAEHDRLEAQERERATPDPGEALRRHVAQISAESGGADGVHAD
jgi:hypothetical protein